MGKRAQDEFENSLTRLAALTALREVALCSSLIVLISAIAIGFGGFGKGTAHLELVSSKTAPEIETVDTAVENTVENPETEPRSFEEPDVETFLGHCCSEKIPSITKKTIACFDYGKTLLRDDFYLECASRGTSQALVNAGGIVEYYPAFYCSHSYDEGATFYDFDPGDVVHIDGMDVTIEGCGYFNYWHDTVYIVRDQLGYDTVLFQTCLDETLSGDVVIYYGHAS